MEQKNKNFRNMLAFLGLPILIILIFVIINGIKSFKSASVTAPDLRGGACLVVAALAAQGETVITDIEWIDRGYETLVDKLRSLGADIQRVEY